MSVVLVPISLVPIAHALVPMAHLNHVQAHPKGYNPEQDPIDFIDHGPDAHPKGVKNPVPLALENHDVHGHPLPCRSGRLTQRSVLFYLR